MMSKKGIYFVSIDMVPTWEYKLDGLNLWGGFLSADTKEGMMEFRLPEI